MKWYSYLICCVLIVAGFFCGLNMIEIWSQKSAIYGSPSSIEIINDYDIVAKFDYGTIPFESEDLTNYESQQGFGAIKFDGTKNDYVLIFNNNLLSDVEVRAGEIVATLNMKFYETGGEVASTVKVNFLIQFFDDSTVITATMKNEENSFGYFQKYMNTNGAILKVCAKGGDK